MTIIPECASQTQPKTAVEADQLDGLADKIRTAVFAIGAAENNALDRAMACGDALAIARVEVKAQRLLWLVWLEKNCPSLTRLNAARYMRLAAHRAELDVSRVTHPHLSIREALKVIAKSKVPKTTASKPKPKPKFDQKERQRLIQLAQKEQERATALQHELDAMKRADVGATSTGEVERLRVAADEYQSKARMLEIQIQGHESEVKEVTRDRNAWKERAEKAEAKLAEFESVAANMTEAV
jgi:hypothetical protein